MRHFGKDELELLKDRVDLVEVVEACGIPLKKDGKVFRGLCFLHPESEPSFTVDPGKKRWRCYGGCTAEGRRGGDVIQFLRLRQGLGFPEALDWLVARYGTVGGNGSGPGRGSVSSPKTPTSRRKKTADGVGSPPAPPVCDPERARLLDAVASHYEAALARSSRAQRYLEKRALLVPEVLRTCRVGFADGSLLDAIARKGETRDQLVSLGVLSEDGREVLNGFVVVPLVEPKSGAVLQLYGRSITGSRHLYLKGELRGLVNGARVMGSEELVVVESVLDSLSLLALGVANVVPIYGVNGWTRDHERLLEEGAAKSVTLLLDNDPAGERAAEALGEQLVKRGLRVRAARLEEHKDPNEALVAGVTAEQMRQVLDEAVPLGPAVPQAQAAAEAPRSALRYELEDIEGGLLVTFGARRYRVRPLAGSGLKQLGALRLKLEDAYGSYLDTLDLGVARARRSFARNASRRFGAGEDAVEAELDTLVEVTEGWIATKAKGNEVSKPALPELSDEERSQALAFLRAPRLLERSVEHMTRLGYVGEEVNKALGYLIVVSRKLEDPLSVLVLSQSGAGKSGLTEVLERLVPPEDAVLYSRLTTNALYYMPKDFLRRKVVIIEERSGSEEADYSLRTLQSRKKLILGVPVKDPRTGRTETKTIEVEGPAVFLQTSTATEVNYENSTRCFELYLDESVEQTKRIHAQQRRSKTLAGQRDAGEAEALVRLHWNAQRLLEPVRVSIPFVDAITFPDAWLRTRRDHLRFLNLIEASAFLHQYQRPRGPDGDVAVVEATVEDYRVAYELAREVLGSTLADLKKPARDLLESVRAVLAELGRERKLPPARIAVTRRELRERTGLPDHQVRRLLAELVALEHVVLVNGSQGRLCSYRLADGGDGLPIAVLRGLLTPEELERKLRPRP